MPAKLKEHFKKVHGSGKYKDTTLEELKQKRARYDAKSTITTYDFVPVGKPILTASYEVAYLIESKGNRIPLVRHLLNQPHCNWPILC